jgi:hypothetical protein
MKYKDSFSFKHKVVKMTSIQRELGASFLVFTSDFVTLLKIIDVGTCKPCIRVDFPLLNYNVLLDHCSVSVTGKTEIPCFEMSRKSLEGK